MRQFVHCYSRSRWSFIVEKFGIHFVVAIEVFHADEERRHIDDIFEARIGARKDIANVFNYGTCLLADIQQHSAGIADLNALETVIRASRTGAGYVQEVAGSFDMWKASTWGRFALNYFAARCFHRPVFMARPS